MKVIGLTRIRNESAIIQETLDHMSEFCSEVFVYDDCSTDNTVEICENHPIVTRIIKGESWKKDRLVEEFANRHLLFLEAQKVLGPKDYFVYMDADERIEFDWRVLEESKGFIDAVNMRLFDFYITQEDVHLDYNHRTWMGPEYRNIPMIFRMGAATGWHSLDQRICSLKSRNILDSGFTKHYGKSVSVEEWESTCDYYIEHFPTYAKKWKERKGKAIHKDVSDFGRPLIKWEDKESCKFLFKIH